MQSILVRAVVLLAIPSFSFAAEPKDDPLAIVNKAIQATGGGEKLEKAKAHSWKAKGAITAAGMKMEYVANYTFALPDKMRFDLDMELGGMKIKMSAATDGKTAWEQMGPELREMAKEKQKEFDHSVYLIQLTHLVSLKDKAYKLTPLGESTDGDQTLVGIKVTREGKRDVSMYFDKKSGLLAKISSKVIDEFTNREVTQESVISGYRDKEGLKVFDKLTIKHDGKDFIVEEMSDAKFLEKVDETMFAKPTGK